jgi:hypothetical protein
MGRIARVPLLIHEFVRTEAGEYKVPIEYKCHVFGDVVGAVQVVEKRIGQRSTNRYYSPAWEPLSEKMHDATRIGRFVDPPVCLEEILATARTLGRAYGTYVRVDLYATDEGCVFGEFAATPSRGMNIAPYADQYFGSLWQELLGDAV